MRRRIATLTSSILSPFLVTLLVLLLLSFDSTSSTGDALKWTLISASLTILPIFLIILYLVHSGRLDAIFTDVRRQRTQIYLLAIVSTALGGFVLNSLGAPPALVAAFTAGLATAVTFMCINLWWKISLHTALVAASVTVLVMLHGWIASVTVVLVPLMSWARIELEQHTLAQAATGALLAALITVAAFYPLAYWVR